MTELQSYVKLKHFPPRGTDEYLNSLPPGIPFKLYKKLFADGEVGNLVEMRLLHVLSNQKWEDLIWPVLEELLVDYYECLALKEDIINNLELEWIKK